MVHSDISQEADEGFERSPGIAKHFFPMPICTTVEILGPGPLLGFLKPSQGYLKMVCFFFWNMGGEPLYLRSELLGMECQEKKST